MRALLALPLLGLAACSNLRPAGPADYARVNDWAAAHAPVAVQVEGQQEVPARDVRLAPDTTRYLDVRRSVVVQVPTARVASVTFADRARGRWLGAAAGAATGAAMGGLLALPVNTTSGDWSTGQKVGTAALLGAVGGTLGFLLGQRLGVRTGFALAPAR